jgi:hypothetical protein
LAGTVPAWFDFRTLYKERVRPQGGALETERHPREQGNETIQSQPEREGFSNRSFERGWEAIVHGPGSGSPSEVPGEGETFPSFLEERNAPRPLESSRQKVDADLSRGVSLELGANRLLYHGHALFE